MRSLKVYTGFNALLEGVYRLRCFCRKYCYIMDKHTESEFLTPYFFARNNNVKCCIFEKPLMQGCLKWYFELSTDMIFVKNITRLHIWEQKNYNSQFTTKQRKCYKKTPSSIQTLHRVLKITQYWHDIYNSNVYTNWHKSPHPGPEGPTETHHHRHPTTYTYPNCWHDIYNTNVNTNWHTSSHPGPEGPKDTQKLTHIPPIVGMIYTIPM